jgi:hypothetical protein
MTVPSRYRVTVLALTMVLAAAVLAVVLAKPAQTRANTTTITDRVPITFQVVNCAGELITVEGTFTAVFHGTRDSTGSRHFVLHNHITATGVSSTGTTYVVNQMGNNTETFSVDSAETFTLAQQTTIIGTGSDTPDDDFMGHTVIHITVNANDEVTAVVEDFNAECR